MRRRSQIQDSRGRFFGIAAIGFSVGVTLFLLVLPAVEREAYLARLRIQDGAELQDTVLHLCWTESGQKGINVVTSEIDLTQKVAVAAAASELGCLGLLDQRLQVLHFLYSGGEKGRAIAAGPVATELALAALKADDATVRHRAVGALLALRERLDDADKTEIRSALEQRHPEFEVLRRVHGDASPASPAAMPRLQLLEPTLRPPKLQVLYSGSGEPAHVEKEEILEAAADAPQDAAAPNLELPPEASEVPVPIPSPVESERENSAAISNSDHPPVQPQQEMPEEEVAAEVALEKDDAAIETETAQ